MLNKFDANGYHNDILIVCKQYNIFSISGINIILIYFSNIIVTWNNNNIIGTLMEVFNQFRAKCILRKLWNKESSKNTC